MAQQKLAVSQPKVLAHMGTLCEAPGVAAEGVNGSSSSSPGGSGSGSGSGSSSGSKKPLCLSLLQSPGEKEKEVGGWAHAVEEGCRGGGKWGPGERS